MSAVRRQEERVTPLELFFDLVFVLAITQCTALMAREPTWVGLAKGVLVLGVLWWSWVGYAWLTSVLDPGEGAVRLVMFAAMAALLLVSLSVPDAFGDDARIFAAAYGAVRAAHIALFVLASRGDPALRRSVIGLGLGTLVGVSLLVAASFLHGTAQGVLWAVALLLDMGEPFVFGSEGWTLFPGHFAERHGLIVIIALGESIVAIGVGAEAGLSVGVAATAVLGIAVTALMWWAYFDTDASVAARRLGAAPEGRVRNEMARDAYSYLHLPMILGIVLVALGLKTSIAQVNDSLATVPAFALVGGLALYLLGHVAFRLRALHSFCRERLLLALLLLASVPVASRLPALTTLALVSALLCALIVYESVRFADVRAEVRHGRRDEPPAAS